MEDILKAINDNVDNVTATAFNVVVAKQIGTGVTDDDDLVISVMELGQNTATAFSISSSDSMDELIQNINNEAGGVVQASLNSDGKLLLSNDTGATIRVIDNSATGATTQFQSPMPALPRRAVESASAISVIPPSSRCTTTMAHGQLQRSPLCHWRRRMNFIVLQPPKERVRKS